MNSISIRFVSLILILSMPRAHAFFGKTFISPRSLSVNAARELVGWQEQINRFDRDTNYWSLAITPEYTRNYGCRGIVNYLFGGSSSFVFSGSQAPGGRGKCDILADYFGLPLDFKSAVCVRPIMSTFIMDFDFYYGLENFCRGLYFRIHAPIGQTNWNPHFLEKISFPGTIGYPAGYMSAAAIPECELPSSVQKVFQGTTTFGDMQEPLAYGKIYGREDLVHISDVQLVIGWNPILRERSHFGFNGRVSLPVGSRYCPEFLFNPIIGNGHHWEAGIGLTGHKLFYEHDDYGDCAFYLDANVTHLFANKQLRSYDLVGSAGSRYMLIEEIISPSTNLFVGGAAAPNQYNGHLFPAINKTTLCTKIRVNVQADCALKFCYLRNGWDLDLGYDFWYRSAEKIVCREAFPDDRYALKGDAQIYGFTAVPSAIALNATESGATLRAGQGAGNFVTGQVLQNLNVDSPAQAQGPTAGNNLVNSTGALVQSSKPAVLLTDASINECSGIASSAISHKIFMHAGYTWYRPKIEAFMGLGGEVEWAPCKNKTGNSALSQWGVWVKGGLSYW